MIIYAPCFIPKLAPHEVYVMGSDRSFKDEVWGFRYMLDNFPDNQIFRVVISDKADMLPIAEVKAAIRRFFAYAESKPETTFLMSKVGFLDGQYDAEELLRVYSHRPANVHVPLRILIGTLAPKIQ